MRTHDVAELAQTLFEEIGDAAFIADPRTMRVLDVNPMAQRLTGLARADLMRLPLDRLFRSDDDGGLAHLQRALHTTRTFHSQEGYYLRHGGSGDWTPVNVTLTRLHTDREPLGLILARDITERVEAEERLRHANATLEERVRERTAELAEVNERLLREVAQHRRAAEELRASEERFRGAFEHTGVAMVLTDIDNHFVRVNTAFARLFGYHPEEMLGRTMAEVTHPDDLAESYAGRERLLSGRGHFFQLEKRYLHRDGRTFWGLTNVSLVRDTDGRPLLYVGQVQDITERKRSEEALRAAQQRLAHVIASSPAVLFTLAVEGGRLTGITWVSDNVRDLLDYAPAEVAQPGWWDEALHPEDRDRVLTQTQAELLAGGHCTHEYRLRHRSGQYHWVRCEARLIRDAEGRPAEGVGSLSDVTERRRLEDQFRQAQKMEAIGRLAGGIAHDFNNLLTVINGYGEIILDTLPAGDPVREHVREIVAAGERAAGLTRQLLTFSRKALVEPKQLDLRRLVANVDQMLRRLVGEDVQLAVEVDPDVGAVRADPGQIEQVIMNLVVNARDAMPRGGRIAIDIRNVDLDGAATRDNPDARPGPYVQLTVADTGVGMDAATLSQAFEPFFTTKGEAGTGLGLATVYGIVQHSGGHVAVASEVGRGTTFEVYLPRIERPRAVPAPPADGAAMPRGGETVLLVEDEEGVLALVRRVLQACGYTLIEARDGFDAVRLAEEYRDPIDLVITDVVMPKMGGREVAERLTSVRPGVKVLYLSGYTTDAVVRHGILESQVAFLQKPFTPLALAGKVREVLDDQPA